MNPRAASVYSLNYDFVPTIAYGDKCFWADLRWPVSNWPSLRIGTVINFASTSHYLTPPPKLGGEFRVSDIIGSRIIITTDVPEDSMNIIKYFQAKDDRFAKPKGFLDLLPAAWSPLDYAPHWGYATRDLAANPATGESPVYGNGQPVLKIYW